MRWRVSFTDRRKRMAILVSKGGHCLIDLLWRWEAGELDAEIPLVISNHADLAAKVTAHGIPYHHLPVAKASRAEQEARSRSSSASTRSTWLCWLDTCRSCRLDFWNLIASRSSHPSFLPAGVRRAGPLSPGA